MAGPVMIELMRTTHELIPLSKQLVRGGQLIGRRTNENRKDENLFGEKIMINHILKIKTPAAKLVQEHAHNFNSDVKILFEEEIDNTNSRVLYQIDNRIMVLETDIDQEETIEMEISFKLLNSLVQLIPIPDDIQDILSTYGDSVKQLAAMTEDRIPELNWLNLVKAPAMEKRNELIRNLQNDLQRFRIAMKYNLHAFINSNR